MNRPWLDVAPPAPADGGDLDAAEVVARLSGVPLADILGQDRHARIARARHVAIWATRTSRRLSFPALGRLFGGRDHRTVMHSVDAVCTALERGTSPLADLARAVELERGAEDAP